MLNKLSARARGESGFTLVELLVVMLILGLLAAIAIPSFFSQRDKARDADAKTGVRTAQTAIESFATDRDGKYTGANTAALVAIEETLSKYGTDLSVVDAADASYTIRVTSSTGNTFDIVRATGGAVTYPCATAGKAGCPSGTGGWGG